MHPERIQSQIYLSTPLYDATETGSTDSAKPHPASRNKKTFITAFQLGHSLPQAEFHAQTWRQELLISGAPHEFLQSFPPCPQTDLQSNVQLHRCCNRFSHELHQHPSAEECSAPHSA